MQFASYVIPEPFIVALRLVRDAIGKEGLRIHSERDFSGELKREFGIALVPCRALSVECPIALLKGMALDSSIAVWLPLRVVVSGRGAQTAVHTLRAAPDAAESPVRSVQDRLTRALQRIAMRENPISAPALPGGAAGPP